MQFLYTLCFIKRGNSILMLNRNKSPWFGIWNGVGGKRNQDETPLDCIHREILEETNIKVDKDAIYDRGIVTWNGEFNTPSLGLHLYFAEVPEDFDYITPIETREGILDWKQIDWIVNKENLGVSYNIPYFIMNVIQDKKKYHYHCEFKGNELLSVEVKAL